MGGIVILIDNKTETVSEKLKEIDSKDCSSIYTTQADSRYF